MITSLENLIKNLKETSIPDAFKAALVGQAIGYLEHYLDDCKHRRQAEIQKKLTWKHVADQPEIGSEGRDQ